MKIVKVDTLAWQKKKIQNAILKRYWKFLPSGNSYRSRTSPIWLKIYCNSRPTPGKYQQQLPRVGLLLQQIFNHSAITQTRIKISFWNFQHLFITSLCNFEMKILAITQTACQPQPISAETLNFSSDCICWDISKRKKLVRF